MALPRQVQAQLAEAEEIEKTLKAQKEPKNKAEEPEVSEDQTDTEAEVSPEAKQEPKLVEVEPADTSPTDVEEETFKQKYTTLQGKYDAEVPRLHQQLRELKAKLDSLEQAEAEKKAEPTKAKEKVSLVTDADRAEFGEELIDVQRRVAKEVASEYEDRFEQQNEVIKKLQDQLAKTGNQVGEMSFAQRLSQLVPDFADVDKDERWVSWLNEHDAMLNGPRRMLAQQAFDKGDAEAVARYVKLWKQTIAEPEADPRAGRQAELEKQVAPNRSANSVDTKKVGKDVKVYSEKEINKAWDRIRNLNTKGQYDDAAKLEAELTAAYIEGRVRM